MIILHGKFPLLWLLMGLVLTACTGGDPYIYQASEFNRERADFATEITDRSNVEICYNKRSTSPKILLQMATDECRRFGKTAVFLKHAPLACSISAPGQAVFSCLMPNELTPPR